MKKPIIIDCDPGSDDAIAMILALSAKEIDLKAVCSVAGNGNIGITTKNALNILSFCGREDIPVYEGASFALNQEIPDTVSAFGDDGLGGYAHTIESDNKIEEEESSDFLVKYIHEHPGEITLFALGPCTNIAKAIQKSPSFAKNLKQLIIMGGAKSTGNVSSVAEYNFWADPLAAKIVFEAGIKDIVTIGLDVTNKIALDCEKREIIRLLNSKYSTFMYNITKEALEDNWKERRKAVSPLHDVLTIAYFLDNSILDTENAQIGMVTEGIAKGQSIVDLNGNWNKGNCNAKFATKVNVEKFYELFFNYIFEKEEE